MLAHSSLLKIPLLFRRPLSVKTLTLDTASSTSRPPMEFRFRAGDERDSSLAPRSPASLPDHCVPPPPPPWGFYSGISGAIGRPMGRTASEAMRQEIQKQSIREEMREMAERRILEEEVLSEMAMERAIRMGRSPLGERLMFPLPPMPKDLLSERILPLPAAPLRTGPPPHRALRFTESGALHSGLSLGGIRDERLSVGLSDGFIGLLEDMRAPLPQIAAPPCHAALQCYAHQLPEFQVGDRLHPVVIDSDEQLTEFQVGDRLHPVVIDSDEQLTEAGSYGNLPLHGNHRAGVVIESDLVQHRDVPKSPIEPLLVDAEKNLLEADAHGLKRKSEAGAGESSKLARTEQCWRCDLCQISALCEENLKDHLVGKKHKKKLANVGAVSEGASNSAAPISTVNAVSGSVADESTVHEQKVPRIEVDGKMHQATPKGIGSGSVEDKSTVRAPKLVNIHYSGQSHQVVQMESCLWCQFCNNMCNSLTMMQIHLSGKKHRGKVVESSSCTKLENTMVAISEESISMQPAEAALKYATDAEDNGTDKEAKEETDY